MSFCSDFFDDCEPDPYLESGLRSTKPIERFIKIYCATRGVGRPAISVVQEWHRKKFGRDLPKTSAHRAIMAYAADPSALSPDEIRRRLGW